MQTTETTEKTEKTEKKETKSTGKPSIVKRAWYKVKPFKGLVMLLLIVGTLVFLFTSLRAVQQQITKLSRPLIIHTPHGSMMETEGASTWEGLKLWWAKWTTADKPIVVFRDDNLNPHVHTTLQVGNDTYFYKWDSSRQKYVQYSKKATSAVAGNLLPAE